MKHSTSFLAVPALGCLMLPFLFTGCKKDPQAVALNDLQKKNYVLGEKSYLAAAAAGDLDAIKMFHKSGMAVDNRSENGTTALMEAVKNGRVEVVKYLLSRKADTGVTDAEMNTPLIKAAATGNLEVVKALLEAGADATAANKQKMTALTTAAMNNYPDLILPLIQKTSTDDINSALALAAVKGNTAVVGVLLNQGADSISRTGGDMTPLMLAAKNGRREVVELLVNNGAAINTVDRNKKTAADLAVEANHKEIADYLVEVQQNPSKRRRMTVEPNTAAAEATVAANGTPGATAPGHASGASSPGVVAEGDMDSPPSAVRIAGQKIRSEKPLATNLRMVDYQSQNLPVMVTKVENETVIMRLFTGGEKKNITLSKGEAVPGTEYVVSRLRKQERLTKTSGNTMVDVSDVLLHNKRTGEDVLAPINDVPQTNETEAVLGIGDRLFSARRGDEFSTEGDGESYRVVEVYPNRVVILDKNANNTMIVKRSNPVAGKF